MTIHKVTISKGQDNDHLFEKKRKKAQPSTEVLNTRSALFQSADVMKKKYFAFFWDLPQIVIKKLWYTYELEVSSSLHTTDDLHKSVNGTICKLQMKWIPWLQQAICIGKERYCNWDVMTGAQWEDCHTTKMLHNKIVVLI